MKLQRMLKLFITALCLLAVLTGCGSNTNSTTPDSTSGSPSTDQAQDTTGSSTADTTQDTTGSQTTDSTQDTAGSQTTDSTQDTAGSQTTDSTQDTAGSQTTDSTQETTGSNSQDAAKLLIGTWESVRREENPYTNSASLITDSFTFNADGTGSTGGYEYVVLPDIPKEETDTGDGWSVAPMGYAHDAFTYTLEGSQLTVHYLGIPEWDVPPHTEVYTLSRLDGNCLVIDNLYGTYLLGTNSLKSLCNALNVDYSLPKAGGDSPDQSSANADMLVGTWSSIRRDEYAMYTNDITFFADGSGMINDCDYIAYYVLNPNMPIEETTDGWVSGGRSYETMYITYSLDGNQLSITYLGFLDVDPEPVSHTEVYTVSHLSGVRLVINDEYGTYLQGNYSLKELCAALDVDYTAPKAPAQVQQ